MLVNRRTLRIEWGQCDPAGIVFYPQYLIIFDTSTGWLFERTGLSPLAMRKKYGIVGIPVVEVGARFVMPCRFDDEVIVESEVSEWGRSSFTVRHRVLREGDANRDCRRRTRRPLSCLLAQAQRAEGRDRSFRAEPTRCHIRLRPGFFPTGSRVPRC